MPPWFLSHQAFGDSPGARLRRARVSRNMTIRDLARVTGLTTATISDIEAGETFPRLPVLRRLAEAVSVPVWFLGHFEQLPENTLAERIRKARLCHGLTLEKMACALGIDPKTLHHWECGNHTPCPQHLSKLGHYLAVLGSLPYGPTAR